MSESMVLAPERRPRILGSFSELIMSRLYSDLVCRGLDVREAR